MTAVTQYANVPTEELLRLAEYHEDSLVRELAQRLIAEIDENQQQERRWIHEPETRKRIS